MEPHAATPPACHVKKRNVYLWDSRCALSLLSHIFLKSAYPEIIPLLCFIILSLHSIFFPVSCLLFSHQVMSNSLQPHGLQLTRLMKCCRFMKYHLSVLKIIFLRHIHMDTCHYKLIFSQLYSMKLLEFIYPFCWQWTFFLLLYFRKQGCCELLSACERVNSGDFPSSPMAKTPRSQCWGPRFNPWSGNWIPHATTKTWHSQINKN